MRSLALGLCAVSLLAASPALAQGGVPPNPFASNYPSAPPRAEPALRPVPCRRVPMRRPEAAPRPPADIPYR